LIHLTHTPWAVVRVRIEPHPRADGVGLETMAIVDTGAEVTHISPEIFHELGVTPGGFSPIRAMGHSIPDRQPRAPRRLTVLDDDGSPEWSEVVALVGGFAGENSGRTRCLLGLDALRFSKFTYEGQLRTGTLEFPGY
jgi:hypothetical protein